MPSYLHQPITTSAALRGILGKPETQTLEFKARLPDKGPELAKDIAALANAEGGDILFGVGETDGRACLEAERTPVGGDWAERLANLLAAYLRPRDFVEELRHLVLRAEPELPGEVLVVSVPPAPYVVAVARGATAESPVTYPVRIGVTTAYLEHAEVARRMRTEDRSVRLRFVRLGAGDVPVRLESELLLRKLRPPTMGDLRIRTSAAKVRWTCVEAHEDGVVLASAAGSVDMWMPSQGNQSVDVPSGLLKIPYSLIRAAWSDLGGKSKPLTKVMLASDIVVRLDHGAQGWSLGPLDASYTLQDAPSG